MFCYICSTLNTFNFQIVLPISSKTMYSPVKIVVRLGFHTMTRTHFEPLDRLGLHWVPANKDAHARQRCILISLPSALCLAFISGPFQNQLYRTCHRQKDLRDLYRQYHHGQDVYITQQRTQNFVVRALPSFSIVIRFRPEVACISYVIVVQTGMFEIIK